MSVDQQIVPAGNFIGNQWIEEGSGDFLEVVNKYDQTLIATLPLASESQMNEAIKASEKGFESMRKWSAGKRSEMLSILHDLLAERKAVFVQMIVAEAGKPVAAARAEVERCLVTIKTGVSEALNLTGEMVPLDYNAGEGKTAYTRPFPIGPIACISPFNFPLNLVLHKVVPAFAVGCSVVLKPSPQAPLVALAFADLVTQAGYPTGAYNALVCDIPVAQQLVTDDRMKMLSFTGSSQVGWQLKNSAGKKKMALELGGNAAVIVTESADLQKAAKTITNGAYHYTGQTCISTQRIYVMKEVYDSFLLLLLDGISKVNSGDPADESVINGPVIDSHHLHRIADWVNEAKANGATILTGGEILNESNNIYAPTLIADTNPEMKVVNEEVFGPVAILEKVSTYQEALNAVNDSEYGLQAGVFTNQLDEVKQAHETLEVGGIMINNVPGFRIDSMPYGGVKSSGLGREGIKYTMQEMTEERLIIY
jgi:acyl-CoA reductase-like NAD-dependent aldehyde dehydrogenase